MANEQTQSQNTEQAPTPPADTSPKIVTIAMWILSLAFVLGAVILMPSLGGVAVLVGALLVCPAQLLRNLPPFKQLYGIMGSGVMEKIVRIVIADALVLAGFALTPWRGGNTVGSLVDLQLATLSWSDHLEYSKEGIDVNDIASCSSKFVSLSTKNLTPATEVGRHTYVVQLNEGPYTKEQVIDLMVEDTQPPVIKLKDTKVSLSLGDSFDVGNYVESVADPVDGDLKQVAEEPKAQGKEVGVEPFYSEGWYYASPKVSTKKAGTKEVTIVARDQHGNEAQETITVSVDDPLANVTLKAKEDVFEYAQQKLDATTLVTCSDSSVKVSADAQLDLASAGKKTIVFTLKKGKSTKNASVEFTVRDTKKPEVELAGTTVTVDQGAFYDAFTNVVHARDVVDGDLPALDAEPSENGDGWYTIVGTYDTGVVGRYDLSVVACDKNGNRVTKRFVLEVKEAPQEAPAEEQMVTEVMTPDGQVVEVVEVGPDEAGEVVAE